jgi:hypothetical protein
MRIPRAFLAGCAAAALTLTACTVDDPDDAAEENGEEGGDGADLSPDDEWFDEEEFERQLAQRDIEPEGPEDEPWLQAIDPEFVDTSEFETDAEEPTVCFSNASISNPWRVTGHLTMLEQVEVLQEEGEIGDFLESDAEDDDEVRRDLAAIAPRIVQAFPARPRRRANSRQNAFRRCRTLLQNETAPRHSAAHSFSRWDKRIARRENRMPRQPAAATEKAPCRSSTTRERKRQRACAQYRGGFLSLPSRKGPGKESGNSAFFPGYCFLFPTVTPPPTACARARYWPAGRYPPER